MIGQKLQYHTSIYHLKANSRLAGAFLHDAKPEAHALALHGLEKFGTQFLSTQGSMANAPAAVRERKSLTAFLLPPSNACHEAVMGPGQHYNYLWSA